MKTLVKYLIKIPNSTLLGSLIRLLGRKLCLDILIRNNIDKDEITEFRNISGYSSITLHDGTSLTAIDGKISYYKGTVIPSEHCGVVLEYITRYKYPHFMPSRCIKTGIIPRRNFPLFLDPQKTNTLSELPFKEKQEFCSALELKKGDQVIEVGSFIGFGTLRMCSIVGDEGKILSVEADPKHFEVLRLNLHHNNIKNAKCINCTVSDRDEDNVSLFHSKSTDKSIVPGVIKDAKVISVKSKSVQSLIKEYKLVPNFLILTVNGAELMILKSCEEFLVKTKHLRIIAPGWYDDGDGKVGYRIKEYLLSLGYQVAMTPGLHVFAYK